MDFIILLIFTLNVAIPIFCHADFNTGGLISLQLNYNTVFDNEKITLLAKILIFTLWIVFCILSPIVYIEPLFARFCKFLFIKDNISKIT